MFERYIYIGDIHGEKRIIKFFDDYNDGKTFFMLMGDIFDRGNYSFEIFIKIKELHEEGCLQMVLGNHDLFLIFGHLTNPSNFVYKEQFIRNGGKTTIKSFRKNIQYKDNWKYRNIQRGLVEISKWLLDNFNIYHIDNLNNLILHGGLPILYDGTLVGEEIEGKYIEGIEYIKKLNILLKDFDNTTIRKFTAINDTSKIISDIITNNDNCYITNDFGNNYDYFIPTWFRSDIYINNIDMQEGIKKELDKYCLNNLILGHDYADEETSCINDYIYRLDMKIGILIKDRYNNIIEKFVLKE